MRMGGSWLVDCGIGVLLTFDFDGHEKVFPDFLWRLYMRDKLR